MLPAKDIIAYCRIGERTSHTWFVLTYLLGYPNVRNYDGSWTEWGNLVGVPIESDGTVVSLQSSVFSRSRQSESVSRQFQSSVCWIAVRPAVDRS